MEQKTVMEHNLLKKISYTMLDKHEVHKGSFGAYLLWQILVLNCPEWHFVALYEFTWPCIALYDLL